MTSFLIIYVKHIIQTSCNYMIRLAQDSHVEGSVACLFIIIQFMDLIVTFNHSFSTKRTMKTSVGTNAIESDEYWCLIQDFILYLFGLFSFGFSRVADFDPYSARSLNTS